MEDNSQYYKELMIEQFDLFEENFEKVLSSPNRMTQFKLNGFRIQIKLYTKYLIYFYDGSEKEYIHLLLLPIGSRKINFKKSDKSNWEFIFGAKDLRESIEKYEIDHPTYYDKTKNKNITFSSRDYDNIFNDRNIIEIFDDEFQEQISINEFGSITRKNDKASNLYIYIPEDNISNLINNNEIIFTDERHTLINELTVFINSEKKNIFWLSGGKKIGKTVFIKYSIYHSNIFYFNFKIFKSIEKTNDKKKNLYRECINLYINKNYNEFKEFYKEIRKIKGYNKNIWELIYKYLDIINKNNIIEPIIVLDDYDDLYMNNDEIMNKKIISNISKYNNLKFIICGNGKFINNLMLNYLSKNECDKNYQISYCNDFGIELNGKKVYNLLYNFDKEKSKEEIMNYLKKQYKTQNELLFKLILFEELIKTNYEFKRNDSFLKELPIQFFKITYDKEKECFKIDYFCEDLFDLTDSIIQLLITEKIIININLHDNMGKLQIIHGYILERYIIGLIEANELLKMNIPKENIIRKDEIYNINENNVEKKENINSNFPILIKQNKEGAYYDFVIIIKVKDEEIYGILIQVGINKKKSYIANVFSYTIMNYDNLINGLKKLTGQNITNLCLLFIFDKEKQDSLCEKLKEYEDRILNETDNNKLSKLKKQKSSIYIGKDYTNELYIPYLEFSQEYNTLYLDDKIINNTEIFLESIWPIINFKEETQNNINKILSDEYKDFSKDLLSYFKNENILKIKILIEISNYENLIKKKSFTTIFIIIFILEDINLIIFKEKKEIKYLYYNKIKKFEGLNKEQFIEKLKNNSYKMFLCEKIFDDKEIYHEEQMEVAENIQIKKTFKRKVPSDYEKDENERKEEEDKKIKKRNKKKINY